MKMTRERWVELSRILGKIARTGEEMREAQNKYFKFRRSEKAQDLLIASKIKEATFDRLIQEKKRLEEQIRAENTEEEFQALQEPDLWSEVG